MFHEWIGTQYLSKGNYMIDTYVRSYLLTLYNNYKLINLFVEDYIVFDCT